MKSKLAFGVAATASLGLHLAGLSFGMGRDTVEIEAGAGAVDVAVGNSFADMAQGTLSAEHATYEPVHEMSPAAPAQALETVAVDASNPVRPTPVTEAQTSPAEVMSHSEPEMLAAEPTQPSEVTLVPIQPAPSAPVSHAETMPQADHTPTTEMLAYVDTPTQAPSVSKRPLSRPATLIVPKPAPPKKATPAPKGNAQTNAKAGAQAKPSTATAAQRGTNSTQATTQGNAAATNYPGQVMRKINRVPKPRVSAAGSAVVRFTIAGSGGLAGLSLARSSGSSQFDKAALRVIRRAAPFPAPPPGAQRSFSLTIKGR